MAISSLTTQRALAQSLTYRLGALQQIVSAIKQNDLVALYALLDPATYAEKFALTDSKDTQALTLSDEELIQLMGPTQAEELREMIDNRAIAFLQKYLPGAHFYALSEHMYDIYLGKSDQSRHVGIFDTKRLEMIMDGFILDEWSGAFDLANPADYYADDIQELKNKLQQLMDQKDALLDADEIVACEARLNNLTIKSKQLVNEMKQLKHQFEDFSDLEMTFKQLYQLYLKQSLSFRTNA